MHCLDEKIYRTDESSLAVQPRTIKTRVLPAGARLIRAAPRQFMAHRLAGEEVIAEVRVEQRKIGISESTLRGHLISGGQHTGLETGVGITFLAFDVTVPKAEPVLAAAHESDQILLFTAGFDYKHVRRRQTGGWHQPRTVIRGEAFHCRITSLTRIGPVTVLAGPAQAFLHTNRHNRDEDPASFDYPGGCYGLPRAIEVATGPSASALTFICPDGLHVMTADFSDPKLPSLIAVDSVKKPGLLWVQRDGSGLLLQEPGQFSWFEPEVGELFAGPGYGVVHPGLPIVYVYDPKLMAIEARSRFDAEGRGRPLWRVLVEDALTNVRSMAVTGGVLLLTGQDEQGRTVLVSLGETTTAETEEGGT